MARVAAVHQPNYLPWLGYFFKMSEVDVFVYLDEVQIPRGSSFAARNRVLTPQGPTFLTVPLSTPGGSAGKATYKEVRFASQHWKREHLKTLKYNYSRAEFFDQICELYSAVIEKDLTFAEMNIELIETFADYLAIRTETLCQGELSETMGKSSDLIIDICEAVGADVYVSGEGARSYNDEGLFAEAGVDLRYTEFEHPEYEQLWSDEFVPRLSVIDLLFNHGPASRSVLMGENDA